MYSHLSFIDKVKLEKLLLKLFLKKNGEINISQIAKCLNRNRSTILREIKRFKTFNFVENSWWNKKNHQYDNLKTNFV